MKKNTFTRDVAIAWIAAGTLDLLCACIQTWIYKGSVVKLLQFIASGAFGSQAFSDNSYAVAGFLFHYLIALIWTIVFFVLYPFLKRYINNAFIIALLYGVFVWLIMNKIVVPASQIAPRPFEFMRALIGASILIVAIGVPLTILAGQHYRRRQVA